VRLGKKQVDATHKFIDMKAMAAERWQMSELPEGLQAWTQAVRVLTEYDRGKRHLDDLLDAWDTGLARKRVFSVFRNRLVIDELISRRVRRLPRSRLLNLLRLAIGELLDNRCEEPAPVVHHAGEVARLLKVSRNEQGFINGVLRQLMRDGLPETRLEKTHPGWLVERWRKGFGDEACRALIAWNQQPAPLYVCTDEPVEGMEATSWPCYFQIREGLTGAVRERVEQGGAYVQDPFALIPVQLMKVVPGETVLDLCAAPGGKTRLLARALDGRGHLTAVDLPGRRIERLKDNLSRCPWFAGEVIGSRIEHLAGQFEPADAVLLDVPCSNTGVMRRRPDVKLRLSEAEIQRQAEQQGALLAMAAGYVRPGGRLCYSTCSLEPEENEEVVRHFLKSHRDWSCAEAVSSTPWEHGHDGGGAFLLTRK